MSEGSTLTGSGGASKALGCTDSSEPSLGASVEADGEGAASGCTDTSEGSTLTGSGGAGKASGCTDSSELSLGASVEVDGEGAASGCTDTSDSDVSLQPEELSLGALVEAVEAGGAGKASSAGFTCFRVTYFCRLDGRGISTISRFLVLDLVVVVVGML
jgi:hypothetical protein